MGDYAEQSKQIYAFIEDKENQKKILEDNIAKISEELHHITADCEKAIVSDDQWEYSNLRTKQEMLTAKLSQAKNELKKYESEQIISEDTYNDIVDHIHKEQHAIRSSNMQEIANHYNKIIELTYEAEKRMNIGNGLLRKIEKDLFVKRDKAGFIQTIDKASFTEWAEYRKSLKGATALHLAFKNGVLRY